MKKLRHYLFELGHSPELASKELSNYLLREKIKYQKQVLSPQLLQISCKQRLDTSRAITQLAGTVRICIKLSDLTYTNSSLVEDKIIQSIFDSLVHSHTTKPNFSLSTIGFSPNKTNIALKIKKQLQNQQQPSRFIQPKDLFLNPIQFSDKTYEFILIKNTNLVSLYQTLSVTDVKSWQKRDRMRPVVDSKSGILPPKTARMLLNLGLPNPLTDDTIVYDPFCGSGTIISEALTLGIKAIGSDISQTAVTQTQENINWLIKEFNLQQSSKIFHADALQVSLKDVDNNLVDAIVSESDLGPVLPEPKDLPQIISTLEQLYFNSLKNFITLLKPKGRVVIAVAQHYHPASVKMVNNLIDTCEKSGYTSLHSPIMYGQPRASVKRAVIILEKN